MDAAAKTLLKNTAFLLALALPIVTPALATTTIAVSSLNVALASQPVNIAVTSVPTTTPMHFTVSNSAPFNWYTATLSGGATDGTTPANLVLQVANTNCTSSNSCTGTVTLTPDTGDPVSISVTLGTGGGGGATNSIQANPNPVSLFAVQGGSAQTSVTISATSGTAISITNGGVPSNASSWLSISQSGSFVSTGQTVVFTFTANAASLANNTLYQTSISVIPGTGGSLTIPVSFCVGSCGGSGNPGANGSMTSTQTSLSFGYPGGTSASTAVIGSTNSVTTLYNASVTSGSWLSIYGNNPVLQTQIFNQPIGQQLTIQLNPSVAATLSTGVYSGTVVVTPGDSSNPASVTINVSLTVNGGSVSGITLSATSVPFSQAVGATAQQSFSINISTSSSTTVSYSLSPSTSSGGSWLATSQNTSTLPGTITVFLNGSVSGSLAQGTYSGNVQVTYGGGVSAIQNIPVTLTVGSGGTGGGGTGNLISPTSLTFTCQLNVNCNSVNVASQVLAVGGSGQFTASPSVSTVQQWLSVTQSGVAPGVAYVGVNPGNLAAGNYQGTVFLSVTTGGSQSVTVTLNVVAGAVAEAFPGSMAVTYQAGGAAIPNQSLTVAMSDNSAQSISVSSNQSWVSVVNQGNNLTASTYAITFNPAGLANGVYLATLTATVGNATNSPLGIPVVLTVTNSTSGGGTANLTFSQSSLTFNAQTNGAAPGTMSLTVTSGVNTTGTVGTTTSSGGNWLSISPSGTVGLNPSLSFTVSANQAGLVAGTYSGSINFNANNGTSTVPVTLVVSATGGGGGQSGNVSVNPSTPLAFSYQVGGNAPAGQKLSITNSQGLLVGLTITTTTQGGGSWLTTNFVSGMTSNTTPLTVSVDPTQLTSTAAGTYTGNVAIQPTGGTLVNVVVTLTVTNVTVTASLPGGGTSLTFSYRAGGANPATQTINVSGSGGALTFSATASSTGNWLSVSPTSGTTPLTGTLPVTVSVNPAGLSAGTFSGTIIVAGTGTATGSTTFNVSITVTAPPPTITGVVNGASFLAGRVSPGEIIAIFGTDLGPTTGVGTAIDPATGKVATTLAGVTVLVSGFPAPLTYVSEKQVNAVVPYEVKSLISPFVQVKYTGGTSNAFSLTAAASSPGIFTVSSGIGPAAALNSNNSVNGPSNPAAKGDTVVLYLTGEGDTNPAGVTGKVTTVSSTPPLTPAPLLAVGVTVDGQPAFVQFVGQAPGFVSGVLQLNIQIPANARTGDLPVFVTIGGASSQNSVTVSVK